MPNTAVPSIKDQHDVISSVAATLRNIVCALVEDPLRVVVQPVTQPHETVLLVTVGPSDLGKVIGKQGRTAESLRAVIHAIGTKRNHRFQLDIRSSEQAPKDRLNGRDVPITL